MRSSRIFWATLLVGMGFLFLANNLGLFTINVWSLFWPVFLILLGIWFLIGTTRGTSDLVMEEGSIDLQDAKRASVKVKHGAGMLEVRGGAESGKLVSGTFANGLDARVKKDGDILDVTMQPERPPFPEVIFPWNWMSGKGFHWDCGFATDIPLNMVFEIGAVEAHLDFTEMLVKDIVLKTGASSTDLKLPAQAGQTHLKVEAGAASVEISVPDGVAARVEASAGLATVTVDQERFPKQNGYYQSQGYDTAENKVDIRIETGLGSIDIK
jgi:hypothetical protein